MTRRAIASGSAGLLFILWAPAGVASAQVYTNCTNQVPAMTSATTPSGVVTRSGVISSSFEGWQAFDASNTSMWISQTFQTPAWIGYEWTSSRLINKYSITYANGSILTRAPRDWQLQAWNGSSWTAIDTRSGQTGWSGLETRSFTVALPGSYSKYRLNVTDDNDTRAGVVVISLGRLTLESCQTTGFCGSGLLCSSQTECNSQCSGNPNNFSGECESGCCYCF
jgi:hypothetical protein